MVNRYIIYSKSLNSYYTGHYADMEVRLHRHNKGNGSTYTKKAKDWELKWQKEFGSRSDASKMKGMLTKRKAESISSI